MTSDDGTSALVTTSSTSTTAADKRSNALSLNHSSSSATVRPTVRSPSTDPSRLLAPEDAFHHHAHSSPPSRHQQQHALSSETESLTANGSDALGTAGRSIMEQRRKRERDRGRSGSRRRKGQWKKLLWVKQHYPDNYTDEETFLDHLQRNPRLRPYEFWPLVGDSTVIVQHVMSVVIWLCCFAGIVQNRVTPWLVVVSSSGCTILGWMLWFYWVSREEDAEMAAQAQESAVAAASEAAAAAAKNEGGIGNNGTLPEDGASSTASSASSGPTATVVAAAAAGSGTGPSSAGPGLLLPNANGPAARKGHHSRGGSLASVVSNGSAVSAISTGHPTGDPTFAPSHYPPYGKPMSPRIERALSTTKSACLIVGVLLGLSPILKSLTKSTTSDSIWALAAALIGINVAFFDYGGGVGANISASSSTNAAIMAATVLASRLEDTTDVFSFMLFSIEVFGLFPVFRRHLRHVSGPGHNFLTCMLVMGGGASFHMAVSGGGFKSAIAGAILGCVITSLVMGACSWWLIGLQKYKNEIHGPWDPARPIIRRRWD